MRSAVLWLPRVTAMQSAEVVSKLQRDHVSTAGVNICWVMAQPLPHACLQSPSLGFYHYEQWRQRRSDAGLPWILHAMISGMKGLGVWQGCWGRARCSPRWTLDAMTSWLKELGVWRECLISARRW